MGRITIRQGWPEYDQWLRACYERASAYNQQFVVPLDENEVNGIVKSIAMWTNTKFNKESFSEYIARTHTSEIQSFRGLLSGNKRKVGSNEEVKPWLALGISRSTWYRRR